MVKTVMIERPVNLYIFDESSNAAVYGIGTYIRALCASLNGYSINITVIHLRSVEPKEEQKVEAAGDEQHWYIPSPIVYNTQDSKRNNELYYRNVAYLLQLNIQERDNLIFHFNYWQAKPLVDELKQVFVCKTMFVVHYTGWGLSLSGNMRRLKNILDRDESECDKFEKQIVDDLRSEKTMLGAVDQIVILSDHMRKALTSIYDYSANNVPVIPNGLNDNLERNKYTRQELRQLWHFSENEKIILFAGRVEEVKGLTFLIRAFCKLAETVPEVRLIVAGNGMYDNYMKEAGLFCSKIVFTGRLEQSQLYQFYQLTDVGVVPSLYEPFGYVAVEMMMHSLPIVVTATSGLDEIVEDGINGLKVPIIELSDKVEIDIDLLEGKINYLFEHDDEAKLLGQNARKRYEQCFSSNVFKFNMLNLYKSLISDNNV